MKNLAKQEENYISSLEIYISKLDIYISKLEIYISRLEIELSTAFENVYVRFGKVFARDWTDIRPMKDRYTFSGYEDILKPMMKIYCPDQVSITD